MRIGQLEYILEVAKTGSLTEAANNLHVSTSSISEAITNLEKKYEMKLFNRSRMGTKPTDIGKVFLEKAFEIQNKLQELDREVQSYNSVTEKKLSLLCSSSVLQTFLPKVLSTFQNKYPDVQIKIREHTNTHPTIMEELKKNEIDIGIITANEQTWFEWEKSYKDIIHFDASLQGRVYVSVNKNSNLSVKEYLTPEELLGETLILYTNTRRIYNDIVKQYGELKLLFESNNTETIKNMIQEGIGITFWSDLSIKNTSPIIDNQIVHIPLANYERANVTYGWAYLKKKKLSLIARSFLDILRLQISNDEFS